MEFRYDVAIPSEIGIADYTIRRDSENFSNAVTTLSGGVASTSTDATSITGFGRVEECYSVDGDAAAAAASNLANRKQSVSEISVTPMAQDFSVAEIGDTVAVYIDGGNDMQFFDGDLRVIEKNLSIVGSAKTVDLQLSVNKIFTPTLLDTIKLLRDRVKKLEV